MSRDVSVGGGGGGGVEMKKERMKVLAVDHALRRETYRASQLSQELKKMSIKAESPLPLLSPGCIYKVSEPVLCTHQYLTVSEMFCTFYRYMYIYTYMYTLPF